MTEHLEGIPDGVIAAWETVQYAKLDMQTDPEIRELLIDELVMIGLVLWNRGFYDKQ